jgi:hypothetical protein
MRFLIRILIAIALTASAQPPTLPEVKLPPAAREAAPEEVQKLITANPGIGILDVRTADEVAELGRLPGAKHLDFFHQDFAAEVTKLGLDPS